MEKTSSKGTLDQKIASKAKVWRYREKVAIGNPADKKAKDAKTIALLDLRKTIDEIGSEP